MGQLISNSRYDQHLSLLTLGLIVTFDSTPDRLQQETLQVSTDDSVSPRI